MGDETLLTAARRLNRFFRIDMRKGGLVGPFALDHIATGLVVDQFGHAFALTLPTFTDPRDRTWAAREIVAALNARFGFEAAADPFPAIDRRADRRAAAE